MLAALLLSAFVPWVVIPLMIVGGAFLCFEGVEKLAHKLLHSTARDDARREILRTLADPNVDVIAFERDKITVEAATILEKPFTEAQLLASLRPLLAQKVPGEGSALGKGWPERCATARSSRSRERRRWRRSAEFSRRSLARNRSHRRGFSMKVFGPRPRFPYPRRGTSPS